MTLACGSWSRPLRMRLTFLARVRVSGPAILTQPGAECQGISHLNLPLPFLFRTVQGPWERPDLALMYTMSCKFTCYAANKRETKRAHLAEGHSLNIPYRGS